MKDYESKTIDELNAMLVDIGKQRAALREQAMGVVAVRNEKLAAERFNQQLEKLKLSPEERDAHLALRQQLKATPAMSTATVTAPGK